MKLILDYEQFLFFVSPSSETCWNKNDKARDWRCKTEEASRAATLARTLARSKYEEKEGLLAPSVVLRGHFRVSSVSLDRLRTKRDCS